MKDWIGRCLSNIFCKETKNEPPHTKARFFTIPTADVIKLFKPFTPKFSTIPENGEFTEPLESVYQELKKLLEEYKEDIPPQYHEELELCNKALQTLARGAIILIKQNKEEMVIHENGLSTLKLMPLIITSLKETANDLGRQEDYTKLDKFKTATTEFYQKCKKAEIKILPLQESLPNKQSIRGPSLPHHRHNR